MAVVPPHRSDLIGAHAAVYRWFALVELKRQGAVKTDFIELSWVVDGRNFKAMYAPASQALEVWMQVQWGTAEAIEIDGAPYRSANTGDEIDAALKAEGTYEMNVQED